MIETERLLLRSPRAGDRAALCRMFADPAVMADLGPVKDAAAVEVSLARHDGYREEGLGFQVVERRDDGAFVGFCGLKRGDAHNPIAGEIEAGWIIDRPHWRRGYAFEAMAAVLAWGWANTAAARIVAITAAVNAASRQLMARLGMAQVPGGDFDHPLFPEGDRLRRTVTYAIGRPA